jgi:hypothetical protein
MRYEYRVVNCQMHAVTRTADQLPFHFMLQAITLVVVHVNKSSLHIGQLLDLVLKDQGNIVRLSYSHVRWENNLHFNVVYPINTNTTKHLCNNNRTVNLTFATEMIRSCAVKVQSAVVINCNLVYLE